MLGSESPSCTRCTPAPASDCVVGFWPWLALLEEAVLACSACLRSSLTSARIGSPLGLKSWKATVSDVQTALNVSTAPQRNVTYGGAEREPPAGWPSPTSIILNSLSVTSLTLAEPS